MRIDDRLAKMNRDKNRRKQNDEDEETLMYAEKKREANINENKGAFEEKTFGGLNSAPSVFDRTAVFKTRDT